MCTLCQKHASYDKVLTFLRIKDIIYLDSKNDILMSKSMRSANLASSRLQLLYCTFCRQFFRCFDRNISFMHIA